jgi:hypothetical protein
MTRARKVPISVLNIAMHSPHSPEAYVKLFTKLFKSRRVVNARTLTGAMIGSMHSLKNGNPVEGVIGEFYQFTDLNRNEPWFDLKNLAEAKEEDVEGIFIPEHLKPHLARFTYVFFPKGHRLYLQTRNKNRTFGINAAQKFLEQLIVQTAVAEFPMVAITVEPDSDTLRQIFTIKKLLRLDITLTRPNPDDLQDFERRLLEGLESQNAKELGITLKASNDESTV